MKAKTAVKFVECSDDLTSEEIAQECLMSGNYALDEVRRVLAAIAQEEQDTRDRRGITDGRQVFGAYCHGGLRGITKLSSRKPLTTRFLNRVLGSSLPPHLKGLNPSWSALMLMRAGNVDVHRDWRNEWGTMNYAMHIPGEVQLWVDPGEHLAPKRGKTPQPLWNSQEARTLTEVPRAFDPRQHHAVRMQPNWLLVGYTPLGTSKLTSEDLTFLESCEFPVGSLIDPSPGRAAVEGSAESQDDHKVRTLSVTSEDTSESSISPEELRRQIADAALERASSPAHPPLVSTNDLSADLQPDTNTTLIGWDFSRGDPGDRPHPGLVHVALADYLRVRGVSEAYQRLTTLGIEAPNDLQFLYAEDLLESGFTKAVADAIMFGIHPPGTRRPDNPQLSSLTTGEVRLLDRAQRPIPWILQNRTLAQHCPGPPLAGLGCRQPDAKRRNVDPAAEEEELRAPDPLRFPEPPGADPTDSPTPRCPQDEPSSSHEPPRRRHAAEQAIEDYQYMMYMQAMWEDEEGANESASPDLLQQEPSSSSHDLMLPTDGQGGDSRPSSSMQGVLGDSVQAPTEPGADPTDSSTPRSNINYSCRAVQVSGPSSEQQPVSPEVSMLVGRESFLQDGHQQIGVPTNDPIRTMNARLSSCLSPAVRKVDEAAYTPNVEDLLGNLTGPLEVVHNVSPAEVRRHLPKWKTAAKSELDSFESMNVIRKFFGAEARRILRDQSIEVIPGKAVCTVKPGDPYKRKFRVVSCGNFASSTVEAQLYAGGAGAESLRTLLVHAAQRNRRCYGLDIKSAFLLAPIPATVTKRYAMRPPRMLVDLGLCSDDEIWMIDRALYGFRESPKWWSVHRDGVLSGATWSSPEGRVFLRQFTSESNIWAICLDGGLCIGHILVYVDDILILSNPGVADSFISWIKERWECTGLKEATPTEPLRFLGVDIYAEENPHGDVVGFSLVQEAYIYELLRSHDTALTTRATAPVPREWVRELPEQEEFTEPELRAAQSVTGELLWLAQRTRVDIGFCVGLMSSWVSRFPKHVTKVGGRVLEYLANTKTHRLVLTPGRPEGLKIYTDASFAPYGSHSISGIVLRYNECTVVWKSKRQTLVTLSTAESELCAGCEGVTLAQSLEALVTELDGCCGPKNLMVDNTAAVTLAEGGGSVRTRHLRARAAFLHDMRERRELCVSHCPGDVQLADCLTKALMKTRLAELCGLLGLGPPHVAQQSDAAFNDQEALPVDGHRANKCEAHVPATPNPAPSGLGVALAPNNGLGLWFALLIVALQTELSEAASEEDEPSQPLGLELSLLAILMTFSILFVWESGKTCLRSCCSHRRIGDPEVRMMQSGDDDDAGARRSRRQEAVRRAIVREVQEGDLRKRGQGNAEHADSPVSQPQVHSYVHVQVGGDQPTPVDLSVSGPRPPPAETSLPPVPSGLSGRPSSSSRSAAVVPPPPPPPCPANIRSDSQGYGQGSSPKEVRDMSTQTDPVTGLSLTELCELQVTTTSSRSPGAVHIFPTCNALRNSPSRQNRMFCRYCLQALREGRNLG